MANFFTRLFSKSASSLVEAVGDAIDKNFTSDEERKELDLELARTSMKHEARLATLGLQEKQAYLADTASARTHQSRVQESEHGSWLSKNIQPLLALFIIGVTFYMFWWVIDRGDAKLGEDNVMKDIIIYILGALTTVSTQVASYFFGSSQGSAEKHKQLAKLTQKNQ
ncbi:hypothetical protein [Endozoicomonas arenosclerae]|uniref:hypothetical protein n=1 Tax=Endozoicomonas arenosclerae TaxID=1633495 RepID=UPI0007831CE7|nr:hypothetical protein [Endozoicomonas arenosclerae]